MYCTITGHVRLVSSGMAFLDFYQRWGHYSKYQEPINHRSNSADEKVVLKSVLWMWNSIRMHNNSDGFYKNSFR